ncbi:cation transport protein [Rhodanobacter thiooxydans LCS2]|nr:cation transport protein [Rhodanobacter thiooxydans LCS2]
MALLVLAMGAGVSFYEGVMHIREPEAIEHPLINYAVLAVSFLFDGTSWVVAVREFRAHKGRLGYFEAFRLSKDPSTFTVMREDSAAPLGLLIALAGVLSVFAILLMRETKRLLIGEPAHPGAARRSSRSPPPTVACIAPMAC